MPVSGKVASCLLLIATVIHVIAVPVDAQFAKCPSRSKVHLRLVTEKGKVQNLSHLLHGRWVKVTRFKNPQHIYDYAASPDERYLLIWHMDFSPRKVSVYDLEGGRPIGRFQPGHGGDLCWNSRNQIVHFFGCGSGCLGFSIYHREGRLLFQLYGGGMDLSPSGRYLTTFPVSFVPPRQISIYDLYDLRNDSGFTTAAPISRVEGVGAVDKIDWLQEQKIRIDYVDSDQSKREVTLNLQSRGR